MQVGSPIVVNGFNLTLSSSSPMEAAIDGNGVTLVFEVWRGATLELKSLTVQNGNGNKAGGISSTGEVILCGSRISNCSAHGASELAGGMHVDGGYVALENTTITSCSCSASSYRAAGGIYVGGSSSVAMSLSTIEDCSCSG